jgi:bifunctional non-homologous end joining protein LigD
MAKKEDSFPGLKNLPKGVPRFLEPMKAHLEDELPDGPDWLYEVKLDGIRAVAVKDGPQVRLFSRRPRDVTDEYPEIVSALARLSARQLVVDGEIVAFDARGRTSFQLLQNRKRSGSRTNLFFIMFDLLHLNGRDVISAPLVERRAMLEKLMGRNSGPLRFSVTLDATASRIWKEVNKLGLEGIIAKRRDSKYEPGRRSGAWVKVKAQNEQEFVIGGYTPPRGSRQYFGSILVGYYDARKLLFASRVGTGFNTRSLRSLFNIFQKLRTPDCPFANLPTQRSGKFGQGVTAADMKQCVWLKPQLVCQVRFQEWTHDDNLRQPVFLGLREDKKPTEVVREKPA